MTHDAQPMSVAYVCQPVLRYEAFLSLADLVSAGAVIGSFARGSTIVVDDMVMDSLVALCPTPGTGSGAALLAAATAAQIGFPCACVAPIGADPAGDLLLEWMQAQGILTDSMISVERTPRHMVIKAQGRADTHFVTQQGDLPLSAMARAIQALGSSICLAIDAHIAATDMRAYAYLAQRADCVATLIDGMDARTAQALLPRLASSQMVIASVAATRALTEERLALSGTYALAQGRILTLPSIPVALMPGLGASRFAATVDAQEIWVGADSIPRRLRLQQEGELQFSTVAGILITALAHGADAEEAAFAVLERLSSCPEVPNR